MKKFSMYCIGFFLGTKIIHEGGALLGGFTQEQALLAVSVCLFLIMGILAIIIEETADVAAFTAFTPAAAALFASSSALYVMLGAAGDSTSISNKLHPLSTYALLGAIVTFALAGGLFAVMRIGEFAKKEGISLKKAFVLPLIEVVGLWTVLSTGPWWLVYVVAPLGFTYLLFRLGRYLEIPVVLDQKFRRHALARD